ncbi:Hypothetical protein, putative [Bodo saltans]|uniref:Uncharacterized protein n=1 Tax=Bodo saltans TaxID=75058 RepID=A0A0S4J4L4_BODSA|nr:Hypothetical protein, putative [Bodo saltans]|eukprot:CUG77226.1 Hypothetical protein, putative [Bodo saltans]
MEFKKPSTTAVTSSSSLPTSSLTLPAGVLERLPFLQDERCVFFDFGLMLFPPPSHNTMSRALPTNQMTSEPIVTVITDKHLVIATFPRATRAPRVIPHEHVCGVSKEGDDRIRIHLAAGDGGDLHVVLGKSDTFVVFLVDLQDRAMGRSMHFVQTQQRTGGGGDAAVEPQAHSAASHIPLMSQQNHQQRAAANLGGVGGNAVGLTASALHAAEAALEHNEAYLGAIRFGRASQRTTRPPAEIDEGSDASSVGTIDHLVDDTNDGPEAVDFPLVSVDSTSLHRRLFYFFQQYDRSKLPYIEQMIAHHRGAEKQLLTELQEQYGPEPNKARWECRDQIAHQRRLKDQLTAQLKRAKDELLLLSKEEVFLDASRKRVDDFTQEFVQRLRNRYLRFRPSGDPLPAVTTPSSLDGLELLCVKRLLPLANRYDHQQEGRQQQLNNSGGLASSREAAASTSSGRDPLAGHVVETVAYWVAPAVFFSFVKDQAERAHGAALPPICVVERSPAINPDGTPKSTTKQQNSNSTFWCNWSFLAGWALEFGAHSVAIIENKASPHDPPMVKYVSSKMFWREATF